MPARRKSANADVPQRNILLLEEYDALAAKLQSEGAESFDASWNDLMGCIASKSELLTKAG